MSPTKPTPPELAAPPLVGHALEFRSDRPALFRRGYETLGPVFSIKLGTKPAAVLIGPQYHEIFFTETDKALSMHKTYAFLAAMFGQVAFTASPETYMAQRHILHAPFKAAKMKGYVAIMQEEVQAWLDALGEAGEMELTGQINVLVQNVAAHALMGEEFRRQMGREFWDLYVELNQGLDPLLPPNLPLPKFRRRDRARAKMLAILQPIVQERRRHPEAYDDFLQEFVNSRYKDGREVEDEVIMNLILGLMFAGHETTAGQAAWTVIELARHPEYLALVREELQECLPPGTTLDLERMAGLQCLEWAVREVSRLHPSADMLLRQAEEDVDVGDYVVPKGWVVFVTSAQAHRLEELFEEPAAFDPLRFAPGREEDRQHKFAMIPFGGGVHKCTGMNFANNEMMAINALLFQQFDVELVTRDPQVFYGMGAARPEPTILRYRRRG